MANLFEMRLKEKRLNELGKQFVVRFVLFARGGERLHGFDRIQIDEHAAQFANGFKVFTLEEFLFLAGARKKSELPGSASIAPPPGTLTVKVHL